MPKERSINPAQAQRKAEKQKEIKKNKQNIQTQRDEKLARRNPDRVQKQIDELKELEKSRGTLRPKDKETLTQLERDLRGIRRAREALGDAAPKFPDHARRDTADPRREQHDRRQHLGKRRRDADHAQDSDTDPEVRNIPMPRDTPPPTPRADRKPFVDPQIGPDGQRVPHALPTKPTTAQSQVVYSSAPQLRDLTKESLKFVPSTVAQNKKRVQGQGRLLEPEEIDKLEKAGYYAASKAAEEASLEARFVQVSAEVRAEDKAIDDIDEELRNFEAELDQVYPATAIVNERNVQLEEVEDKGD